MKAQKEYYAVIFSNQRSVTGNEAYGKVAQRMMELAATQDGFLGAESARDPQGFGITVSYWESEESIKKWKENTEHLEAQIRGRSDWYDRFHLRVAKVEREYHFDRSKTSSGRE